MVGDVHVKEKVIGEAIKEGEDYVGFCEDLAFIPSVMGSHCMF